MCELGATGPILICCGSGNNAGDGFVMARHLELRGWEVSVFMWGDPHRLGGDAATNFRIMTAAGIPFEWLQGDRWSERFDGFLREAAWVVDALLGTGARGAPRAPLDEVILKINGCAAGKVAVDIPSGLDCDTGEASETTIRADHTCTFVAAKPGLVAAGAREFVGQLHILEIGAPRRLRDEFRQRPRR
jgi:NAD(P)H-hydrate epimerase